MDCKKVMALMEEARNYLNSGDSITAARYLRAALVELEK